MVFTPKGLLRLAGASSRLEDLTSGTFQFVLDDPRATDRKDRVERLVLCSGKLYYDIDGHERREQAESVAIARAELLYPFARDQLAALIDELSEPRSRSSGLRRSPRTWAPGASCGGGCRRSSPRASSSATSGARSARARARAIPAAHRKEQERIVLTALEA